MTTDEDAGTSDAGIADAGEPDGGEADSGVVDGGGDAGAADASTPCSAKSCAAVAECGLADDGCGGTLNCGACPSGESCTFNLCGCAADGGCSGFPELLVEQVAGAVVVQADAGTSYRIERGGEGYPPVLLTATSGPFTFFDHSPPPTRTLTYRLAKEIDAGVYVRSAVSVIGPRPNEWLRMGNDNQGSGVNPVETGRPPLTFLWSTSPLFGKAAAAVIANGRVWTTRADSSASGWYVRALDARDGGEAFAVRLGNFQNSSGVGGLLASNGALYAGSCFFQSAPLKAIDVADGGVRWSMDRPCSAGSRSWSSLALDGVIYSIAEGVYGNDSVTGSQKLYADRSTQGEWGITEVNGRLFAGLPSGLSEFNLVDGGYTNRITVTSSSAANQNQTWAVLAEGKAFFGGRQSIRAADLFSMSVMWSTPTPVVYSGRLGYYRGKLYAIAYPGSLVALDPSTGAVLWSFSPPIPLTYSPVFAGNYLYVSSDSIIYALDVNTHDVVWTSEGSGGSGGELAIADGILVASSFDVSAYELSHAGPPPAAITVGTADPECLPGFAAADAGLNGRPYGAACAQSADCQGNICFNSGAFGQICSAPCTNSCPCGMQCSTLGVCQPF